MIRVKEDRAMVKINGEQLDAAGMTMAAYLRENGMETGRIAVELNGEILPKAEYESYVLSDGDTCEIVNFVGGG